MQLWLMPASGGEPYPLTYGEWDETGPRWSPDGAQIAFISNRGGDLQLRLLRFPGGNSRALEASNRRRLRPSGTLHLTVRDEQGSLTAARAVGTDASGRFYAPAHAWTHRAEFDRNEQPFEARYFHTAGDDAIEVPAGTVSVELMKGLARAPERRTVEVHAAATTEVEAILRARPWLDGSERRWVSADVHVHMNYGGHYRNTPAHLVLQAQAEDLDIVENLIVNKEQRIPDIASSGVGVDPASTAGTLVVHGQEFHTSYWGHLGILGLRGGILLPGYAGYPNTAAASLSPTNADIADLAHARGALIGYVHPFEEDPQPLTRPAHTDADELPVDVALGHAQVVCNGRVARELALGAHRDALEVSGTLPIARSGWCLLRAFTAGAEYPILDNFVYATTSPVYVSVRGERPRSLEDARYFEAWIDHLLETTARYPDWNSQAEKTGVLNEMKEAGAAYGRLA